MDIKAFIEAIEPLQATTRGATLEEDLQLMSITSLAVSAKRIADALDRLVRNDTARTHFTGPEAANLQVAARCDVRER